MGTSFEKKFTIVKGLSRLTTDKTLREIRTADICKEAGVSRQTFYRCFDDKYDAAIWFVEEMVKTTVRRIGIDVDWRRGLRLLVEATARNQRFIRQIFDMAPLVPPGQSSYVLEALEHKCVKHFIEQYEACQGKPPDSLIVFQITAYTKMLFGLLNEWLRDDMPEVNEDFLDKMLSIIPRELFISLNSHCALDNGNGPVLYF